MKEIGRAECRLLGQECEEALKAVAEKHGLNVVRKGGRYGFTDAVLKFEFTVLNDDGTVNTPERQAFLDFAESYGLKVDDLDMVFISRGTKYVVSGLNTRARKFPISALRLHDKARFKFPAHTVKNNLLP